MGQPKGIFSRSSDVELGAWLHAPSMSALGLRLDDKVLRVAVGLRLRVSLCKPPKCHQRGVEVDHLALHSPSCKKRQDHHLRCAAVNDLLKRSLASAKIPSLLEPTGIECADRRQPDGILVMRWNKGQTLVWDAMCPDTFTPSQLALAAREVWLIASETEKAKTQKYVLLSSSHHFILVAIKISEVFGPEAISFISELWRRIGAETGELRSLRFLLQGLSAAIQRGNATTLMGTSPPLDKHK